MHDSFISRSTIINTDLPSGEKLLLIVLRAFQDRETGKCQPSKAALCKACGFVTNTMKKYRDALKAKGLIDWKSENTITTYTFTRKSVSNQCGGESINGVGYDQEFGGPRNDSPSSGIL